MEEKMDTQIETTKRTKICRDSDSGVSKDCPMDIWQQTMEDFQRRFELHKVNVKAYSPLALAYIGDTIFDLIFRTLVVSRFNMAAHKYHKEVCRYVSAVAQSEMVEQIQELFTDEELEIYKRGRNSKPYNRAKNASVIEYQRATGLEALVGYLYLDGRMERIFELIKEGICRMNGGE